MPKTAMFEGPKLLCGLLAGLIAPVSAPVALAQEPASECAIPVPEDETFGVTFLCGQIDVPEDWHDREGATIPISYVVLKSTNLAPFGDPVIYFQGGPGGSALNSLSQIAGGTVGLRQNRDLIIFDQRGTAHSNELLCPMEVRIARPDTYDEDMAAMDARMEAMDIGADSDPAAVYEAYVAAAEIVDYRSCVPHLEAQGIDISQYNTQSTVHDVIALMRHLDYPAYNLFGGSYGTTVTLAILDHYNSADAGSLPRLRVSVIDGVAPPNREYYEEGYQYAYVILRILARCEADAECSASYPSIRQRAVDLLAQLDSRPLTTGDGSQITSRDLAGVLRSSVSLRKNMIPFLPRLIAELEQGRTETYEMAQAAARLEVTLPDVQVELGTPPATGAIAEANSQLRSIHDQFAAIEEELSLLLGGDAIVRAALLDATSRSDLFVKLLEGYIDAAGGSVANLALSSLEPLLIHREQRTKEGLSTFVQQAVIIPSLQAEMVALIERLSDQEVASVYGVLTRSAFYRGRSMVDSITHRIIQCNDLSRGFFNDVAFAEYATFEAPQLIGESAGWVANYQVSCEQLGLASASYEEAPPGVYSDIPTLVVNGELDTATPAEWGFRAAETLSNATVVTIPMSGHVSGIFNECGKALVESFILAPNTPLNTACIDDAGYQFVQPSEPLPN